MRILQHFVSVIAPHACLQCGKEGAVVCADCAPGIMVTKAETCYRCNRLSPGGKTCSACHRRSQLAGVKVASHYAGGMKELIGQLKYYRLRDASGVLASYISPLANSSDFDVVTSVPAATNRYRQRGYNQAELIAREVAAGLGIPYRSLLRRVTNIQQVGHSRHDRLHQVEHAFAPGARTIAGQRVLIVDDVLTTGATLEACARILKTMGAKSTWGAVAAKH